MSGNSKPCSHGRSMVEVVVAASMPLNWVAVKELKSSYHNGYIYIYKLIGFPQCSNLIYVP